jgi:hypothetical protein
VRRPFSSTTGRYGRPGLPSRIVAVLACLIGVWAYAASLTIPAGLHRLWAGRVEQQLGRPLDALVGPATARVAVADGYAGVIQAGLAAGQPAAAPPARPADQHRAGPTRPGRPGRLTEVGAGHPGQRTRSGPPTGQPADQDEPGQTEADQQREHAEQDREGTGRPARG